MNRSYEEQLAVEGFLLKQTKGISMEPMLRQGQEQSLIRSVGTFGREPKRGDVVLFRRGLGEYVLHRIVARKGSSFLIRGDNCLGSDLVERKDILGILVGFYRGETYVDCQRDRRYLRYARRQQLRFLFRRMIHLGSRLKRAVMKK